MAEIIIATKNQGKVKDFEVLFATQPFTIKSLLDYPEIEDIEETGKTFTENAIIKAEAISRQFNQIVIADDSGLAVDILNGRPGIFTTRYAGLEKDDSANIKKVLEELKGVPQNKRGAAFHCALALAVPGEKTITVEGVCKGRITDEPSGENGFGYDPIFYVDSHKKTMAQLSKEEKNKVSHRREAIEKLNSKMKNLFKNKE